MVIEDIVMGFTEISANSEGGFSSIFVEDKVGRGNPRFWRIENAILVELSPIFCTLLSVGLLLHLWLPERCTWLDRQPH